MRRSAWVIFLCHKSPSREEEWLGCWLKWILITAPGQNPHFADDLPCDCRRCRRVVKKTFGNTPFATKWAASKFCRISPCLTPLQWIWHLLIAESGSIYFKVKLVLTNLFYINYSEDRYTSIYNYHDAANCNGLRGQHSTVLITFSLLLLMKSRMRNTRHGNKRKGIDFLLL